MLSVSRFAPSPTGLIHLGNARTALFSYLFVANKKKSANFLLRIEDTDRERSDNKYVEQLQRDLKWLGIVWDAGPTVGGKDAPYFQSQRQQIYDKFCNQLLDKKRAYPCFCSVEQLAAMRKAQIKAGMPPKYDGRCSKLSPLVIQNNLDNGVPHSIRFKVPANAEIEFVDLVKGKQRFKTFDIGDFIIVKADGTASFFYSNSIDDSLMSVSHVFRGDDHLSNTPRQILILQALGLSTPAYGHLNLIIGGDNAPLSKRNGSRSITELREVGFFPIAIVNYMARLGHNYDNNELMSLEQLADNFIIDKLGKSPSKFDEIQLEYWQKHAIKQASNHEIWDWLSFEIRNLIPPNKKDAFIEIVRSNVTHPMQAKAIIDSLCVEFDSNKDNYLQAYYSNEAIVILQSMGKDFYQTMLDSLIDGIHTWQEFSVALKNKTHKKGKELFLPIRLAITGEFKGAEMDKIFRLMDLQEIKQRITNIIKYIE